MRSLSKQQIEEQLKALDRGTKEILKSKKRTLKFLIDAGIVPANTKIAGAGRRNKVPKKLDVP